MANEKRLIDANLTEKILGERYKALAAEYGYYDHYTTGYGDALSVVEEAPTVDAVEVVHGRLIPTYHTYYNREGASQIADEWHCSECGIYSRSEWNYCPNCGADMRGSEE